MDIITEEVPWCISASDIQSQSFISHSWHPLPHILFFLHCITRLLLLSGFLKETSATSSQVYRLLHIILSHVAFNRIILSTFMFHVFSPFFPPYNSVGASHSPSFSHLTSSRVPILILISTTRSSCSCSFTMDISTVRSQVTAGSVHEHVHKLHASSYVCFFCGKSLINNQLLTKVQATWKDATCEPWAPETSLLFSSSTVRSKRFKPASVTRDHKQPQMLSTLEIPHLSEHRDELLLHCRCFPVRNISKWKLTFC